MIKLFKFIINIAYLIVLCTSMVSSILIIVCFLFAWSYNLQSILEKTILAFVIAIGWFLYLLVEELKEPRKMIHLPFPEVDE